MMTSFDCNESGIPDQCDIASGYSQDTNHNGIPDECEGQQGMWGGGGGNAAQSAGSEEAADEPPPSDGAAPADDGSTNSDSAPWDEDAAWLAFYEWSMQQCWGPQCELSGSEQFQRYLDKLAELGLPLPGDGGQL